MDPEQQIAAIDQDFSARIAAAPEADRQALQIERETAKNAVWSTYRQAQVRVGFVAEAVTQFPRAPQSAIQGSTREEVMASAKSLHEHFDNEVKKTEAEMRTRLEAEAAQRLYGPRPQGGGGGGGNANDTGGSDQAKTPFDRIQDRISEVAVAHKEGRGVGQVSGVEHDRFIQAIGDTLIQRQITGQLPDGREPQRG